MKVSIIITSRNYGRFLAECIESCLLQTVKCEVIYSDDFSEDDSVSIASEYPQVTVLKHDEHVGVAAARNEGARLAQGKYLLFVDGDDVLTADYVERHLEVMDEGVPFVYGSYQMFGKATRYYSPPFWGENSLWQHNFANSSSLVNAEMFWKVGGWKQTPNNTYWDWDLWLRMQRLGTPRKSSAMLMYRKHGDSSVDNNPAGSAMDYCANLRRFEVLMTVGLVYSGRLPGLLWEWMDALVRDVAMLEHVPQLIIINNSGTEMPNLEDYAVAFSEIKVVTGRELGTWRNMQERGEQVATLLADSFNTIQQLATGDLIHTREDDNITEVGAFAKMFDTVTYGLPLKAAVAAIYQNRHTQRPVGGHFSGMRGNAMGNVAEKRPVKVDYTGTGCLLYWKDLTPKFFSPMLGGTPAHDWRWGHDLKQMGQELWLLPDAVCRHYTDEVEYVLPSGVINGQNCHARVNR